jgi:hypothetical protein
MSEWQPIDTAPRDGSKVLGCHGDSKYVVVVYWRGAGFTDGAWPLIPLTHWQPLPDPPKP